VIKEYWRRIPGPCKMQVFLYRDIIVDDIPFEEETLEDMNAWKRDGTGPAGAT